jgi:CRP/FNR family transcriptional regulator, cyclic AMP receptor protein
MESLIDRILFLQKVPIFENLSVEELGHIASISETLEYDEGEYLFKEGDIGYNAFVIISGSVEIFRIFDNKQKIVLSIMETGDCFGEMAIFDGYPRSASAITLENSIILSYKKEALDGVITKYPSIAIGIIKIMSERVRHNGTKLQKYEQLFSEFKSLYNKLDKSFFKDIEDME